jgi:uncharacterized protein YndB with AHSA1/START domain
MNTPNREAAVKRPATAQVRQAQGARAVTDGEIVLATIDVPVPPERVFRALMTDECERWWGAPGVYTTDSWSADVRTGGTWSLVTRLRDGTGLPASGEFLEVDAPSKIVQTRRYDWDHPTLGGKLTRVTTRLAPIDGRAGTRITVRHEDFGCSEPAYEHAGGWERLLDWLGAYLAAERGGAR